MRAHLTIAPRTYVPTEHLNESDVSGYIDDDLPLADRRRVEAHLEACSECRATIVAVMRVAESFEPSVAAPRPMAARPHRSIPVRGWKAR